MVSWYLFVDWNVTDQASSAFLAHSQVRNELNYLTVLEDAVIQTPSHRVNAFSSFDVTFALHQSQQSIKLSLEPNHDIIPDGATVQYLDSNGNVKAVEPINRNEHRVFKGTSWVEVGADNWERVGWARIVVRRDGESPLFEGAFTILHDHHHIQLQSNYDSTRHELDPIAEQIDDEYMVVWRDSDISDGFQTELKRSFNADEFLYSSDTLSFNTQKDHPVFRTMRRATGYWGSMSTGSLFGKRQDVAGNSGNSAGVNLRSTIGQTAGCPTTRKVALIGVATDCTYTQSFNSSETARQNVITQINSASDLYESTFNISLGLSNLTVSEANCPGSVQPATPWNVACSANTTLQDRLNTFSQWRGKQTDSNAYWTLLTTCNTGSAVGLAWLGQACVTQVTTSSDSGASESVSGTNVVARTSTEWQVIA
jgi:hypothetical protein